MSPAEDNAQLRQEDRFRIGTLLYFQNEAGQLLLIKRSRKPNQGLWCAVGGKLEMPTGESPYECAIREAKEELNTDLAVGDLELRCLLSEKRYEGTGHWLMFIFLVKRRLEALPQDIEEGTFGFFEIDQLQTLEMPEMDRSILLQRVINPEMGLSFLRCDGDGLPVVEEGKVAG